MAQVVHLEPYGGHTEAEMLALAAAAERGSSHPLAAALVGAAAAARVSQGEAATNSVVAQGQVQKDRKHNARRWAPLADCGWVHFV